MKKISYFGKEYTVSDDIRWVATCSSGNVLAFTEYPRLYSGTWVTYESCKRIGVCGDVTTDLENSLRKVEDILVKEGHPHADLMLKYAMIAQYDDKPWECFEFKNQYTHSWMGVVDHPCWDAENEYRLKPQEPKIQVGQTWVSREGVEVVINVQSNKDTVVFMFDVGGMTHRQLCGLDNFLQNFKLKESK